PRSSPAHPLPPPDARCSPPGEPRQAAQADDPATLQRVAYLLAADNVPGPLLTQLIDPSQPVLHTGNEFSRPRLALLASIWAHVHRSTPRSSTAPLVTPSAAEATAARGTGAPL